MTPAPSSSPLSVLQITDTHLGAQPGATLLGMDTDDSLQAVLQEIHSEAVTADLLIATGDIALNGAASSYRRFAEYAQPLAPLQSWIAGNHDLATVMDETEAGPRQRHLVFDHWQLIALDSAVPGEVGGHLADSELTLLEQCLSAYPRHHALVTVHHHLLSVGCQWLDEQKVRNADELLRRLRQHPAKVVCVHGHIHQEVDTQQGNTRILATPSTCIQFAPNSDDFLLDQRNPGYRRLYLHADGSIETGVRRVSHREFIVDTKSGGYE